MVNSQRHKNESLINILGYCFIIVVCSVVIRLWLSGVIEDGGDAFFKWGIIRRYVAFDVLPSLQELRSHHMMRWSIILPVFFIQKLLGTHPVIYYAWPILISTIGAIFVFFITRNCFDSKLGLIAALAFIISKPFLRQGSQFLPMGPATVYMLGGILFFQNWLYLAQKRDIALAGIFWFLAWGAKITSIYYLPAFFFLMLFQEKPANTNRMKSVLFFFALIILLFAFESILTSFSTGMVGGRVTALISNSDIMYDAAPWMQTETDGWRRGTDSLLEYLASFLIYFKVAAASYRTIFLYYLAFGLSCRAIWIRHQKLTPLCTFYILGFMGHAYAIISVFPFLRPERINPRYLTLLSTLAIIVVLFHFFELFKQYQHHRSVSNSSIGSKLQSLIGSRGTQYLLIGYGLFLFSLIPPMMQLRNQLKTSKNGILSTYQNTHAITNAISAGREILVELDNHSKSKRKKTIKFFMVYDDPRRARNLVEDLTSMNMDTFKTIVADGRPYVLVKAKDTPVNQYPEKEPLRIDI